MRIFLLLIAFILTIQFSFSQEKNQSNYVIELSAEGDSYLIGKKVSFLEDKMANLNLEQILLPEYQSKFTLSDDKVLNFGVAKSAIWVKITLKNTIPQEINRWLIHLTILCLIMLLFVSNQKSSGIKANYITQYFRCNCCILFAYSDYDFVCGSFFFVLYCFLDICRHRGLSQWQHLCSFFLDSLDLIIGGCFDDSIA
jgi:hypothetical protein